jgi:hypothetical protein
MDQEKHPEGSLHLELGIYKALLYDEEDEGKKEEAG